jgi:WhiB family redox-sensing transcriptional regulator
MSEIVMPVFNGNAACAQIGGDAWFPEPGGEGIVVAQQARDVCNRCEIRQPCLQWALERGEAGIWGGLTEDERAKIRKRPPVTQYRERVHGNEAGEAQHRRRGEPVCERCKVGVREIRTARARRQAS